MREGAILFSEVAPGNAFAADFHGWYDNEHIPVRMVARGFIGAQHHA